jgi:6-phosphogluconolactonase
MTDSPTITSGSPPAGETLLYVGTYADGRDEGIFVFRMDMHTGDLRRVGAVAGVPNPSFLAIHPDRRHLYAVSEVGDFGGGKSGAVYALALAPKTGLPAVLNAESSKGGYPCHLSVDRSGKYVLAANYGSGSVAVLPIGRDGRLGAATGFVQNVGKSKNPQRQEGPHAHEIILDTANRFALCADLGADRIFAYRFDPARGTISLNDAAGGTATPGSGPRHLTFDPPGRKLYVINEMASTITAYDYESRNGVLRPFQTVSTTPDGFAGSNTTAEIAFHPSGRLLFGSNRGHDSIAIFRVDARSGRLSALGHQSTLGRTPRGFGVDPGGRYLVAANQDSNTLVVFAIDAASGRLRPVGDPVPAPKPVCIVFP